MFRGRTLAELEQLDGRAGAPVRTTYAALCEHFPGVAAGVAEASQRSVGKRALELSLVEEPRQSARRSAEEPRRA